MIKNYKKWYLYKLLAARIQQWSIMINPECEMRRAYYKTYHRYPDLDNPRNLIEKIYWMQLHVDTTLWTKCADKYAMRDYVSECGYEDFLPKNLGKWEKAKDIDFSELPNEFVLKSNNGCKTVLLVHDKSKLDERFTKKQLQRWLNIPYGWSGGQLHYTRIKPCIIAEEMLHQDDEQKLFSPNSMVDYKVWCINGEPENVLVVYGRSSAGYSLDLYDTQWNRLGDKLNKMNKKGHFTFQEKALPKPDCLSVMLEMARNLSKPFPEVRVDFYIVNGNPVIGELTFTTGYGYFTDEYYDYLGKKIDLNKVEIIK